MFCFSNHSIYNKSCFTMIISCTAIGTLTVILIGSWLIYPNTTLAFFNLQPISEKVCSRSIILLTSVTIVLINLNFLFPNMMFINVVPRTLQWLFTIFGIIGLLATSILVILRCFQSWSAVYVFGKVTGTGYLVGLLFWLFSSMIQLIIILCATAYL